MAGVLAVSDVVAGRRKMGWFLETLRKYALDLSVNFSGKPKTGLLQLHKTVQEELKDGPTLRVCNTNNHINQEKQNLEAMISSEKITKMENMEEEMNVAKLKNETPTEKLEPISSNEFPQDQARDKSFVIPNRKRIFIRSRL